MKVAIVHDFFFQYGGAEKVVEKWLEMYPNADLFTSFFIPEKFTTSKILTQKYNTKQIKTTIINQFFNWQKKNQKGELTKPFTRFQKHFFWLYPILMRFMQVSDYDLVLISSTDCAKQVQIN